MWNKLSLFGDINVNYVQVKSDTDNSVIIPTDLKNPIWDSNTIALANFNYSVSASSFEGANISCSKYKIYRFDEIDGSLKYIATVDNTTKAIKDFTGASNTAYHYLIYPIAESEEMGNAIVSETIVPKFKYWSVIGITPTDENNVYIVKPENIWNFWLSPEVGNISQTLQKKIKTGFKRHPNIISSKVNYTTIPITILLGDLSCIESEYCDDSVKKKNRWNEFVNSSMPKILTDPKGECILGDITSTSTQVAYNIIEMPTTLTFEFTQTGSVDDMTVYSTEVEPDVSY